MRLTIKNGDSQPSLHHGPKEGRFDMSARGFGRRSVQPLAGPTCRSERQVSLEVGVVRPGIPQLREIPLVDLLGQVLLPGTSFTQVHPIPLADFSVCLGGASM